MSWGFKKHNLNRFHLGIVFFAVFIVLLAQCRPTTQESQLTIAHPETIAALPLQLAAKTNPAIRLLPFTDHTLALAQFLRGEVDLLFTGTTLGASQASKGVRLWRTIVWGSASIITQANLKNSPGDLKILQSKKVALPFAGSPNDIQLRRLCQKLQIIPRIEYHPHTQAAALLLKNKLDAIVVPEPLASRLVLEHGLFRLAELSALEADLLPQEAPAPMVSLFLHENIPSEKKALLTEVEKNLRQALVRLTSEAGDLAAQQAPVYQVSPTVLREGLKHTRFELPAEPMARQRTLAFLRFAGIEVDEERFFVP